MKYLLSILTVIILLQACGPTEPEYPTDLKGKQVLLKEKQKTLRELTKEVAKLESEIETLDPNSKKEKPRTLVTTQVVEKSDFNRFIELQAGIESEDMVAASSETGGRLMTMTAKEGQYIKKGALIGTIDMQAVDKQIAELEKSLELAVDVFNRQKKLWDQNIGSEMQFLQAKNNKERLEKSIESVKFQLTKANVYAPISGVVDMVIAKPGEMTAPGSPIVQFLNTSRVKVVADIPEKYLRSVKQGQMMDIQIPALELKKRGRVTMLGRSINPANRTFKVEINLNNANGVLKPNLLATVLLNDFSEKNVITVPLELVQQEVSGNSFVYVKGEGTEGATAKKIKVVTGESYEGKVIITEGLIGGEEIIVAGARNVVDGELIKIQIAENNG